MLRQIEFLSEGATLRGSLFLPNGQQGNPPVIIMAPWTSATTNMVADHYAEAFRRAGFAVLLYDHRNLGRSGGEPRQEINPWIQCRGYRDAINFVETQADVDATRIALWGGSYSGAEVIVVGAIDERVKAVAAQCPVCGQEPPSIEASKANFDLVKRVFLQEDVRGSPETTTGPIPVVSSDQIGTPSLLRPIQAFRWFIDYGGRHGTHWMNSATRVIPTTLVPYNPVLCAPFVRAPVLMMVAPDDEMVHCNYGVSKMAFDLMPEPKQWYDISGGHFGLLYYPSQLFDEATRVQIEFFTKCLEG
jgi:uncharacterized protein